MNTSTALERVISKRSKMNINKTRSALNALTAAINYSLETNLISLDYSEQVDTYKWNVSTQFELLGRKAIINILDIDHGELRFLVAVPAENIIPSMSPVWNMRLGSDYDFMCYGWLERKTGKFIQGVITCKTKNMPWNKELENMQIHPAGYEISRKFFM